MMKYVIAALFSLMFVVSSEAQTVSHRGTCIFSPGYPERPCSASITNHDGVTRISYSFGNTRLSFIGPRGHINSDGEQTIDFIQVNDHRSYPNRGYCTIHQGDISCFAGVTRIVFVY